MNDMQNSEALPAQELNDDTPPTQTRAPKSTGRWWLRAFVILGALLLILTASIIVAAQSERGTRLLWRASKVLSAGHIQAQWVSGSLAKGGNAESVNIHLNTVHIDIYELSGAWQWEFLPVRWNVPHIAAQRVDISIFPSTKESTQIQKITMPFAMAVDDLNVRELNIIQGLKTTQLVDIAGSVLTDKVQHHINLTHLRQAGAQYAGQLDINGLRPFAMNGQVNATVSDEQNDYAARVIATGDLKHLNLDVNADAAQDSANQLAGQGHIEVQLIDGLYIHQGHLDIKHINPKLFWSSLPQADLDVILDANPTGLNVPTDNFSRKPVNGNWSLTNRLPLTLSELGIPVLSGKGDFTLTDERQILSNMQVQLMNGGSLLGAGAFANRQGQIDVQVQDYNLKTIHPKLLNTALDGAVKITLNSAGQRYDGQLAQSGAVNMRIDAGVLMGDGVIDIQTAKISGLGNAQLALVGKIQMQETMPFEGKLSAQQFNLRDLGDFPSSQLAGAFDVNGDLKPNFKLNLKGELQQSRWANANAQGQVDMTYEMPDKVEARQFDVTIGENRFQAKGALGKPQDRLNLNINAPNLAQLQFGFAGSLNATGDLSGALMRPRGKLQLQASQLVFFDNRVQSARVNGQWETGDNGPMNADVSLVGYDVGRVHIKTLDGTVRGTQASHQFNSTFAGNLVVLEGSAATKTTAAQSAVQWILDGQVSGSGSVTNDGWRGQLNQLRNVGQPNVQMAQAASISFEKQEFKLSNFIAKVQDAQLNMDLFSIQGQRINAKGNVKNLVANRWLSWLNVSLPFYPSDDFAIKGQWDITMGAQPSGGFNFERERGNVALDVRRKNIIELSDMDFQGRITGTQMALSGQLNGASIGQNRIQGNLGLVNSAAGWVVTGLSPLNMQVNAKLNTLNQFNHLFGVNVRVDGQAQADLTLKGTLSSWIPEGVVTGQNLSFYELEQGMRFSDGVARIRVEPSQMVFEQFDAKGVDGTLSVKGTVGWGVKQGVNAQMTMNHLRPFARPDREVVLSGTTQLAFDGVRLFTITGNVSVDKALIDMPPFPPPSLGGDVHLAQSATTAKNQGKTDVAYATQVDLNLDLGNNFRFKGQGADVYMAGNVRLHSESDNPEIRANGTVKITRGTYLFYGQTLTVQRGLVTFAGPIDDPSINILANRNINSTEVGVEVSGTLADTRVRLNSNPDMPDEEKLAWMLFGRSTADLGGNDISAIAGAASLLLGSDKGRKFTERFGIDSINVGAVGTKTDGTSGTYVGVGKQFTDRFGVAYEQGIDTVSSVIKMTWSLSRSWQIVLRGGTTNGIDLQYRKRFDRISLTNKNTDKKDENK
ncbi:MAG: tamB [Burkholderiaceae bacterium]|nr:tamB [Burkholderiaceae bacterium]